MIHSPIFSFVDFENRLPNISLPQYRAQLAFQFYFSAVDQLPVDGSAVVVSVADVNNNILFTLNATITEACAWGVVTGIDEETDFPITVGDGEIIPAATYNTIYDLWDALQAVGIAANSETFIQCCKENLQDYTLTYTTAGSSSKTIHINFYRGVVYVDNSSNNQEADFEDNGIHIGDCYKLAVTVNGDTNFSNVFKRVNDTRYLTFLTYSCNEDEYEFYYGDGSLINKLWLSFHLKNPSPLTTRKIYQRSDGTYKVQSSKIQKELEGITDYFPEELHDRLIVALEHDNKHAFSNGRYEIDADLFMNSDYTIAWQDKDIYDAPKAAMATFKILKFFAGRNSNCERRPVCIPLPNPGGGGGGGGCVGVTIVPITLPDGQAGVPYSVDIMFNGDAPFVVSGTSTTSTGTDWAFTDITNGVRITGTPTADDVAGGISFGFHVSNCSGNNSQDFSQHINVESGAGDGVGFNFRATTDFPDGYFDNQSDACAALNSGFSTGITVYLDPLDVDGGGAIIGTSTVYQDSFHTVLYQDTALPAFSSKYRIMHNNTTGNEYVVLYQTDSSQNVSVTPESC